MDGKKRTFLKPLAWVYGAIGAFTVISVVVPIIWDKIARRDQR